MAAWLMAISPGSSSRLERRIMIRPAPLSSPEIFIAKMLDAIGLRRGLSCSHDLGIRAAEVIGVERGHIGVLAGEKLAVGNAPKVLGVGMPHLGDLQSGRRACLAKSRGKSWIRSNDLQP